MKVEIKVPPAGESVSEATVSRILKESGSFVQVDEEILELETDKVNQVVYAPAAGKLELSVKVDQLVKIGQSIGSVDTEVQMPAQMPKAEPTKQAPKIPQPSSSAAPSARQMPADFLAAPQKPAPPLPKAEEPAQPSSRKKMSKLRKTIAERLVAVKQQTAMLTTFNEVDMSAIIKIRTKEQESFQKANSVKLGFMSFFIKATLAALKEFPIVGSMLEGDEIVTPTQYDIGVAVSTERGLMVPVLRKCEELNFAQIEKQLADFAKKAREGTISLDDLKGGCFTITNGGTFGSLLSTPILNPPQSAILGMHAIIKRPIAVEEQVALRPMMYLALSYDHRLIDGREAVLFLVHLKNNLEAPARLLLDL